jgi:hypothetical protein
LGSNYILTLSIKNTESKDISRKVLGVAVIDFGAAEGLAGEGDGVLQEFLDDADGGGFVLGLEDDDFDDFAFEVGAVGFGDLDVSGVDVGLEFDRL